MVAAPIPAAAAALPRISFRREIIVDGIGGSSPFSPANSAGFVTATRTGFLLLPMLTIAVGASQARNGQHYCAGRTSCSRSKPSASGISPATVFATPWMFSVSRECNSCSVPGAAESAITPVRAR